MKCKDVLTNDVLFKLQPEANGGHEGQSSLSVDRSGEVMIP